MKILKAFTYFIAVHSVFSNMAIAEDKVEVPVGAIIPLTGNSAVFGFETNRAIQVFESLDYDSHYRFKFKVEDGQCGIGPSSSTAAHNLIGAKKVVAILAGCSGEVLQIAPIAEKAQVIVLGVTSSSPDIKKAGEYIYRTYPDISQGAKIITDYFNSMELDRIAILTETNSFTVSIRNELNKYLDKKIVLSEDISPDETNYRSLLLKARNSQPKAYYLNMSSPTSYQNIVKQIRQMGIQEPLFAYYNPGEKSSLANLGVLQEGVVYFDVPDVKDTTQDYKKFINTYTNLFPQGPTSPFLLMTSYNGLKAIVDMVIKTNNDSTKFKEYLNNHGVNSALGIIDFDEYGDLKKSEFILRQIVHGKPIALIAK